MGFGSPLCQVPPPAAHADHEQEFMTPCQKAHGLSLDEAV